MLFLLLLALPLFAEACVLLPDDARPKGLEERALDSEIVLAAYTRAVFRHQNHSAGYSAEFLVFNTIKGEDQVAEVYRQRKPSPLETALNRRLVNASNFGDSSKCYSEVKAGETYILFLEVTADHKLTAWYDGVYGPAVVYSRDKELALEAIGSSPWSEWSPCSGSCGGGIQQRRRHCDAPSKCSNREGQQRTCNMFACAGTLNALEVSNVHRSSLHPSGRPSAYKLLPSGSWRSKEESVIFPRTFPWEFSLLVTLRAKQTSSGGFLLRVLHTGSLQVGLYMSDKITLVLSDKDGVRVSFVKTLFDGRWNQVSFSVRRNTVSFFVNCEFAGKLPIPGKVRPFGGIPATVVVGSMGPDELDAYQGDVEQLTISGSPDDAEKQCNSTTQPFPFRAGSYSAREEVRSRPLSVHHSPQNDQLPLRGDLIDDEDFSFDDDGSGHKSSSSPPDDDYSDDYGEDDGKETTAVAKIKEKDKIPLKAEIEDDSVSDDDDEDEDYDDDDDEKDVEDDDDALSGRDGKDKDDDRDTPKVTTPKPATTELILVDKTTRATISPVTDITSTDITTTKDSSDVKLQLQVDDKKEMEIVEDTRFDNNDYDYNRPDDEIDKDDDEGSGDGSAFELAWSEWSPCSSTCNWGRRTRTSYCVDNGRNLDSCSEASMKRSETEACFAGMCPPTTTTTTTTTTEASTTTTTESTNFVSNKSLGFYKYNILPTKNKMCRVKCLNGGTCHPPYKCRCPPGYHGIVCQYAMCKPHCLNGGSCVAPNKCQCRTGYAGKLCHKAMCEHGCKNGGECVAPDKCACRSGFTGKDCGEPLCNPSCQNGGTCIKPYFCHCPPGTKGAYCEKTSCKPECQNGGTCLSSGKCVCPKGYGGINCEQAFCPGGCLNGGKCGKTGKCLCPVGYAGLRCDIKKPCKFREVKEPYKRGFKQKIATHVKVPCGAWGWKMCTKTKVHYETVYKTFFRTSYECEGAPQSKQYLEYKTLN